MAVITAKIYNIWLLAGLRNALISNFNPLNIRADKGALWENFLVAERIKFLKYHKIYTNTYFWRTAQQQEIDWVEERDGNITAYEFKWQTKNKIKVSKNFTETYKATLKFIDSNNYFEFIS